MTLTKLLYHAAQMMKTKKSGKILTIASMAWFQPLPTMDIYAATKSFVLSLSNSLHYHCKTHGVTLSCLCPGLIKPSSTENKWLKESLVSTIAMDCNDVASAGRTGLMAGHRLIIPWRVNKALSLVTSITPTSWSMKVSDLLG
jgi:short-subunit dehydrogenase